MSGKNVGYSRPPEQHRFKKGQSGNPRGRPRKSRGAIDPLNVLDAEHKARVSGKIKQLSSGEIKLRKQVQLALEKKDIRAILYLIAQFEKYDLIAGEQQRHLDNVILIPSDLPDGMFSLLQKTYGHPPWSEEEREWAKRVYLRNRTERQRRDDEFIGWPGS
ncbi:DUF5681 domain-containing protein [Erythrobacter sp. Alg231-14]|uniref:DUF5681 domain-containing protein n=1 Tax=Erythrobacter sp. Alg231-14 TaxID=1922225 RepID=UPI000D55AD9A